MGNQLIAPSILSADFSDLKSEIQMVNESEADWFHIDIMDEVSKDTLFKSLKSIKNNGMKAGVAVNPDTNISLLEKYIQEIDLVCLMGVFPGFSGQAFIEATFERCKAIKDLINKYNSNALIEVDGGVTLDNAKKLIECGADILVSGSHVFKADNPKEIISKLKDI